MAQRLLGLAKAAFRIPLLRPRPLDDVLNPWAVVSPLQHAWHGYDLLRERGLLQRHDHVASMLDTVVSRLKAKNVLHPHAFYPGGWGHVHTVREFASRLAALPVWASEEPAAIAPTLTRSQHGRSYAHVWEGVMPTVLPLPELPRESLIANFQLILPACWSSQSRASLSKDAAEMTASRPLVLLLAGTGEQGFMRRRHLLSYPLARLGVASLIMESPFYGKRRPPTQHGSKIAFASDLCVMGRVTIEEARSLVRWAASLDRHSMHSSLCDEHEIVVKSGAGARDPFFQNLVLAGTSQGGLHSAMVASTLANTSCSRVGVCSWLGPPSASQVFTLGALANSVDWSAFTVALQDEEQRVVITRACEEIDAVLRDPVQHARVALQDVRHAVQAERRQEAHPQHSNAPWRVSTDDGPSGHVSDRHWWQRVTSTLQRRARDNALDATDVELARVLLTQMLRVTDITSFTPPARPDACVFTTALHDQYVRNTAAVRMMWEHVQREWKGSDVRSVSGGHVSASVLSTHQYVSSIMEVVRRLRDGGPSDT